MLPERRIELLADPAAFTPWPGRVQAARTGGLPLVELLLVVVAMVGIVVWVAAPDDSIALLVLAPVGVVVGSLVTRRRAARARESATATFRSLGLHARPAGFDDEPGAADDALLALRAVGLVETRCVAVAHGPAWRAAPDAWAFLVEYGSDDTLVTCSGISVTLAPQVASRYAGITVEFGGPTSRLLSLLALRGSRWPAVGFERDACALGFTVRAHPLQDDVAVFECFDPSFLDALPGAAASVTTPLVVVTAGSLVVLEVRDVFGEPLRSRLAGTAPDPTPLATLAAAFHRRLLTAWD